MRRIILALLLAVALCSTAAVAQPPIFARVGTLEDPATAGTGSGFKEVEVVDLNEDGTPDFILPQKQPGTTGAGSNRDILYLSTSSDLILAVDTLSSRFTLKNTAQAFPQALMTTRAYDVEIGDLDGDGALDMVRPDFGANLVVWWGKRDGKKPTGTFDGFRDVFDPPGFNPNALCGSVAGNYDDVDLADVDKDGDLDFVVSQRQISCPGSSPLPRNFIVENLAIDSGGNQPRIFEIRAADPSIPLGVLDELPARQTHSVIFGDVDPPSQLDVVLAEKNLTRIFFSGVGNDPFDFEDTPLVLTQPGITGPEVVVADLVHLNSDNFLDLVVAQNAITGVTHGVYFHSGDSANPYPQAPDCGGSGEPACSWEPAPTIDYAALGITNNAWGLYDARFGDLDDDGRMEIISVNQNVGNSSELEPTVVQVLSVNPGDTLQDRTPTFMEAPSTLTGGMGVDLADLDNDGDEDMILGGATKPAGPTGPLIASTTVYENRTRTVINNRTLSSVRGTDCVAGPCTVTAIDELTAGPAVDIPSGADVTFEAGGTVRLTDGFTASVGSEFTARNF